MSAADIVPPVTYAWWVLALGLLLLVGVAAWLWWLLRHRHRPAPAPSRPAPGPFAARVDALEARFQRGEIDLRALHLALAALVRDFGTAWLGRDISALTRGEVDARFPQSGLGTLLARFEQPSFAHSPAVEAATSVRLTREVIAAW